MVFLLGFRYIHTGLFFRVPASMFRYWVGAAVTKAQVLSDFVTKTIGINAIFERKSAIMFTLVNNTDAVIYLPAATDPYSNQSNEGTTID